MSDTPHSAHRPRTDREPSTLGAAPPGTLSMGHLYPLGDVLAVVDDKAGAERAIRALKDAGVPEGDVDLVDPAWFSRVMHQNKERWTPIERVVAFIAAEEGETVRAYLQETERGHWIVVAHAEQPETYKRVGQVLVAHGAHNVRHFGQSVITDLS